MKQNEVRDRLGEILYKPQGSTRLQKNQRGKNNNIGDLALGKEYPVNSQRLLGVIRQPQQNDQALVSVKNRDGHKQGFFPGKKRWWNFQEGNEGRSHGIL